MKAMAAQDLPERGPSGGAGWFLLGALACGLVAGMAAVRAVSAASRRVPVVVASQQVPPLSRIGSQAVALKQLPVAAVPPGALRTPAQAVGRFVQLGLAPGEVVTSSLLETAGTRSTMDVRLAGLEPTCQSPAEQAADCPEVEAVTIPLTADQGLAMVRPGDLVDVVGSYSVEGGTVAQVLAERVQVLSTMAEDGSAASMASPGSGWLVLALSPSAALRVELVAAAGHLSVLLHAAGAPVSPGPLGVLSLPQLAGVQTPGLPALAGQFPAVSGAGQQ